MEGGTTYVCFPAGVCRLVWLAYMLIGSVWVFEIVCGLSLDCAGLCPTLMYTSIPTGSLEHRHGMGAGVSTAR